MQKLTEILLDVASQLSTIFLQENGIMLLKHQSIIKNKCQFETTLFIKRQCSSVNWPYFNIMLSHGMFLEWGWIINAEIGVAES